MKFEILSLFPEIVKTVFEHSIIKRAVEAEKISYVLHNFRDFAPDKRGTVDDRPFGGGPGMVLKCQPIFDCIEHVINQDTSQKPKLILLSPQGKLFNQKIAHELSEEKRLLMLCGHYEGFDERIREGFDWTEISIGEYVISGGELAASVIIDAVTRLIPGVLGDESSTDFESFEIEGLLDFPQYTRPRNFRGATVPDILFSGNHEEIAKWRFQKSIENTMKKKPEVIKFLESNHQNSADCFKNQPIKQKNNEKISQAKLKINQSEVFRKFSQLPYLQRERKNIKSQTFNPKKKNSNNHNDDINKGDSNESVDSQS